MLEITTATKENTLLQINYYDTWIEAKEQIDRIKKMDLDNIEINLYKRDPTDFDAWEIIDNFYKIEKKKQLFTFNNNKKDNRGKKENILLLTAGAVAFPIMLLFEVIKKK